MNLSVTCFLLELGFLVKVRPLEMVKSFQCRGRSENGWEGKTVFSPELSAQDALGSERTRLPQGPSIIFV